MKKLIILLPLLLAGCFSQPAKNNKIVTKAPVNGAVENEFVFGGDVEKVESTLKQMGVQAEIMPIIKGKSYQVRYKGTKSLDEIAEQVQDSVEFLEPNYRVANEANLVKQEWPADRYFYKQWPMNNIGQSAYGGLPGDRDADLKLMEAWKITTGSKKVVVAVVDTGVDYTHEDLKENIWVNSAESEANGGIPGVDDDHNGYTDDVYGFDFTTEGRTGLYYGIPGDPDPMDQTGHGTHVAGTIGAMANNDVGVTGVNWNVSIMVVRSLGENGGNMADSVRAVHYAVVNKADIISASWGGKGSSELLKQAIREAEAAGVLFVAAAGNDGKNIDVEPTYPASFGRGVNETPFTNMLTVGATDNKDNPADFSNYGHESVDVFAPGVGIVSTYPTSMTDAGRPPYMVMAGTSMATPHVSGIAALMIANNEGYRHHAKELREALIATSDQKESLIGRSQSNGRVNALRALQADVGHGSILPNWNEESLNLTQSGFTEELIDVRQTVKKEGAQFMKLHFNFVQINEPYDSIYIYDSNWRLVTRVETTNSANYWSPVIPGDTIHVRYVNSMVERVQLLSLDGLASESACYTRGGSDPVPSANGKFSCMVDSNVLTPMADGSGGNKKFNSFNSQGYSIDRVAYVAATQTAANEGEAK